MGRRISVTVGVAAYNEEANIGALLEALRTQRTEVADLREVIVVASGCTDRTEEIVASAAQRDPRIILAVEPHRRGKASALNEVLRRTSQEVVVLESADTLPAPDALEHLVRPLVDSEVGVVAARPVPGDDPRTRWGAVAHTFWELHHQVSLQVPKTGELFAFRRVIEGIPPNVGADEDWIRSQVEGKGFRVLYAPKAVVYNAGPKTLREFLSQRARVNFQEVAQRRQSAYVVPTWRGSLLFRAVQAYLRGGSARRPLLLLGGLEVPVRLYAALRGLVKPEDLPVWEALPSTKVVRPGPRDEEDRETPRLRIKG